MRDIAELRARIDEIDSEIMRLFLERMEVSSDVAEYKRATGKPVLDPAREQANIDRAAASVPPELSDYASRLEALLMEASRAAQYQRLGQTDPTEGV